jgi:BirA family biotin operon repressor/biotin-[acetyl-CoA-carboxylase] ligase
MIEHYHFHAIDSTNDRIKELLEEYDRVIVTTDIQKKGHGRNKKVWEGSSPENVYFSLGIRHHHSPPSYQLSLYQAAGALSAYEVLAKYLNPELLKLKYPNDIMVKTKEGYRKLCGVLIEHSFSGSACQSTVIGIGINVNQDGFEPPLDTKATSLIMNGVNTTPAKIILELSESIAKYVYKTSSDIFDEWQEKLNIVGKNITITDKDGIWKVVYMLEDGRLKLTSNQTGEVIIIGDGDSIQYDYD